jgi:hypothetical protein
MLQLHHLSASYGQLRSGNMTVAIKRIIHTTNAGRCFTRYQVDLHRDELNVLLPRIPEAYCKNYLPE